MLLNQLYQQVSSIHLAVSLVACQARYYCDREDSFNLETSVGKLEMMCYIIQYTYRFTSAALVCVASLSTGNISLAETSEALINLRLTLPHLTQLPFIICLFLLVIVHEVLIVYLSSLHAIQCNTSSRFG
jgi:hypothetical protein